MSLVATPTGTPAAPPAAPGNTPPGFTAPPAAPSVPPLPVYTTPPVVTPPVVAPPADPGAPPAAPAPVDETTLRASWEADRIKDRPASADAYTLPTHDALDAATAAASPVILQLRQIAFDAGMPQAGFEKALVTYVEGEAARINQAHAGELAALGQNAAVRTKAIGDWLGSQLAGPELEAVCATLTTAAAVKGMEQLMNRLKPQVPGDPGGISGAPVRKSKDEIRALQASAAYTDPRKRDPAVIAEVEAWYASEYRAQPK